MDGFTATIEVLKAKLLDAEMARSLADRRRNNYREEIRSLIRQRDRYKAAAQRWKDAYRRVAEGVFGCEIQPATCAGAKGFSSARPAEDRGRPGSAPSKAGAPVAADRE